ncbi:hypothetical protein Ancab_006399 [Ancistrocladus abbreviatus]
MENEGIRVYRLRPMGGNQVLLSTMGASSVVESVERDRQLLKRWFKIIRPWKETDINESVLIKVDDAIVRVIVREENPTRGHSWCQKLRVGKCALSSPSVTRVADFVKSMEILGQKLPPAKQRNDERQTMEEDPTAQILRVNLGKINAEFSEANSRPKS